jgi:dihydrofolate reductase
MGKVILQMMTTLDGFAAGPRDELDWIDNDPVMGKAHYALAEGADAAIMGHAVYHGMAQFWPKAAANPNAPNNEAEFGKLMNQMHKIVVSTKPEELSWENCEQLLGQDEDDIVRKAKKLKQDSDGYLLLYGGVTTARTFIKYDLVDEYRLDICPIALGAGKPIFSERKALRFVSATPYESGAMTVTYRAAK